MSERAPGSSSFAAHVATEESCDEHRSRKSICLIDG